MTAETAVRLPARPRRPGLPLAVRFAARELRAGLSGFYVFILCIALGVGAIAAVNSLAAGLTQGIEAEGQSILGGDVAFSLIHREASAEEAAFLADAGRLARLATLRAMARVPSGRQTLVELKGVDGAYPLYGTLALRSGATLDAALAREGDLIPALVDETLLATADLAVGDTFSLGRATAVVRDVIEREPDRLAGGIGFGPRVIVPIDTLAEMGLVDIGSLVRWRYNIAGEAGPLDEGAIDNLIDAANDRFPSAGWRTETRGDAAPGLRDSIARFAQFLTIVGLTALGVGGVGVANAVRAFVLKKRQTIATVRILGGGPGVVLATYAVQIGAVAAVGILAGLVLGAIAPPLAAMALDGVLPTSGLTRLFPGALALAALYGALTAVAFATLPLGRALTVRPASLFRGDVEEAETPMPRAIVVAAAASGLLLAVTAVVASYDRTIALAAVAGVVAVFILLRVVASGIVALARRVPKGRRFTWRFAIANIHAPGALTPTVVLSLGLSLTLIVTLALVDANLRSTLTARLPSVAPSFFFVDIGREEVRPLVEALATIAPDAAVETQPMLRGRIVAINGTKSEDWPDTEASWVLRGDRGITFSETVPDNSRVVSGAWWAPGDEAHSVSFAANLAEELGVAVGDTVRVNVLGREVEATIANLRTVDWDSLAINFVMVFSPSVFAGAPHGHLATLTLPEGSTTDEVAVLRAVSDAFPTITSIRVKDALDTVNGIVSQLAVAIRAAASVTLVAAMLVLAGTLAAGHQRRMRDAAILKVLGARRRTLVGAYALEYALLGTATAVFGIAAGTVASWLIAKELMEIDFVFMPSVAVATVLIAVLVTVSLGLAGAWRSLGVRPAQLLRSL